MSQENRPEAKKDAVSDPPANAGEGKRAAPGKKTSAEGPSRKERQRQMEEARKRRAMEKWADYDEQDFKNDEAVRKARKGCLISFLSVSLVFVLVSLMAFIYISSEISGRNATLEGTTTFAIERGLGDTRTVAANLKDAGLIQNETIFRLYVKLFAKNFSGFIARDDFELRGGMSYDEIIEVLTEPPPPRETVWVTFPEGSTAIRFARICEENGLCTAEEFVNALKNGDYSDIEFIGRLAVDDDPLIWMELEGFLAANTYEFYVDETPENIVRKLLLQFQKDIEPYYARMEAQNMTLRETITLASIIEKEAGDAEFQPRVAGVFFNRLQNTSRTGGKLGSDATTRYLADFIMRDYGAPDYTGLTLEQMKDEMLKVMPRELFFAYYTLEDEADSRVGLPVGPICNPSITAIVAALWPENHNYYYFNTTTEVDPPQYFFSYTYEEHLANVRKAQQLDAQALESKAA